MLSSQIKIPLLKNLTRLRKIISLSQFHLNTTLTEENEDGTQEIDISDAGLHTSAIKRSAPYMRDGQHEPFNNVKNKL